MQQLKLFNTSNYCLVDNEDYNDLNKFIWYEWILPKQNTNYARRKEKGKILLLHRIILNCSSNLFIDHKNGNGLDCQKDNLRIATKSQNNSNVCKNKTATSIYHGVSYKKDRSKWVARGRSKIGLEHHIGYFDLEIQAALAYNDFCIKYNAFSKLNIIENTK